VSSAFSMGGVAIWSMHYIGNRGITLYGGESGLQLSYSAGYTTLSFFIPILVLLFAYAVIGGGENPRLWRLLFGGTFGGAAICGMHYFVFFLLSSCNL
jgi:NO-binding membrane sensor protein with MHYT domain